MLWCCVCHAVRGFFCCCMFLWHALTSISSVMHQPNFHVSFPLSAWSTTQLNFYASALFSTLPLWFWGLTAYWSRLMSFLFCASNINFFQSHIRCQKLLCDMVLHNMLSSFPLCDMWKLVWGAFPSTSNASSFFFLMHLTSTSFFFQCGSDLRFEVIGKIVESMDSALTVHRLLQ